MTSSLPKSIGVFVMKGRRFFSGLSSFYLIELCHFGISEDYYYRNDTFLLMLRATRVS